MNLETIRFENNTLEIIDQTLLPNKLSYIVLNTLEEVFDAIKNLKVRGAPAIGVTAGYGLYIYAVGLFKSGQLNLTQIQKGAARLKSARPTAVNLAWAVDRMVAVFETHAKSDPETILTALDKEAKAIHQSDQNTCDRIGRHGAQLLPQQAQVITHCNTGALATAGIGTALAVVYQAVASGKQVHVFVDETRPVGQGARLTYWELQYNHIPATLMTDSMAAVVMRQQKIDAVLVGADRIAANGDVANKIGTYGLAVLARYHRIPFYVAAPLSSFDFTLSSGSEITIEHRPKEEVLNFWGIEEPEKFQVFNPAFDVTPAELISAIITEQGVIREPDAEKLSKLTIH